MSRHVALEGALQLGLTPPTPDDPEKVWSTCAPTSPPSLVLLPVHFRKHMHQHWPASQRTPIFVIMAAPGGVFAPALLT